MSEINKNIAISTSGLNSPKIKDVRLNKRIKSTINMFCLQKTNLKYQDTDWQSLEKEILGKKKKMRMQ